MSCQSHEAAGSDENIILTPPIRFDLDTPKAIRLRKKLLNEHQRKRAERAAAVS